MSTGDDVEKGVAVGLGVIAAAVPGIGTAFSLVVGGMMALANALNPTVDPTTGIIAVTSADARALLGIIHLDPAYLFKLSDFALANGYLKWEDLPTWGGYSITDADRKNFTSMPLDHFIYEHLNELYNYNMVIRGLRLLAGMVPGATYVGPLSVSAIGGGAADPDHFSDPAALNYMQANFRTGGGDSGGWDPSSPFHSTGADPGEPLTDIRTAAQEYKDWVVSGRSPSPRIQTIGDARATLKLLRTTLGKADLRLHLQKRSGAHVGDLTYGNDPEIASEIKVLRRQVGDVGPDPILGAVFGDVTVQPPPPRQPHMTAPVESPPLAWGPVGVVLAVSVAAVGLVWQGMRGPKTRVGSRVNASRSLPRAPVPQQVTDEIYARVLGQGIRDDELTFSRHNVGPSYRYLKAISDAYFRHGLSATEVASSGLYLPKEDPFPIRIEIIDGAAHLKDADGLRESTQIYLAARAKGARSILATVAKIMDGEVQEEHTAVVNLL